MTIAVFLPNWVGDVVMATPALSALRSHFAAARLVAIRRVYVAATLSGLDWFQREIDADRFISAVRQLRRERPALAVLFTNSFRTALLAKLGGCARIIGYGRDGRTWLLSQALSPRRRPDGSFLPCPILDSYNTLAEAAGTPAPGRRLVLATTAAEEALAERVWQHYRLDAGGPVVALHPGAAYGSAKHWPASAFVALARRLIDERNARVLILCGPHDRDLARAMVRETQRSRIASLAEEPVSLGLTKACIRRADLLITTDSGPRHFAAAFERPVVTLFGPTHIAWTETYYPRAVHLQKAVPCGPCQQRVCPLPREDPRHHCCMRELHPDEVFAAATELLQRYAVSSPPPNKPSARRWSLPWVDAHRRAS